MKNLYTFFSFITLMYAMNLNAMVQIPQDSLKKVAIEGAFGVKLGDVFNTKTALDTIEWGVGTASSIRDYKSYKIDAKDTKPFTSVWVWITPKTNIIYRISAKVGELNTEERIQIIKILRKKYFSNDDGEILKYTRGTVINQGNRTIDLIEGAEDDGYLDDGGSLPGPYGRKIHLTVTTLWYSDEKLEKKGDNEYAEIKIGKGSGL